MPPPRPRFQLQQGLSKEVSPKGIRVVRVSPGWVETEAAVRLVTELAKKTGTDYEGARQDLMKSLGGIPIGRPALPKKWRNSSPSRLAARGRHHRDGVCYRRWNCSDRLRHEILGAKPQGARLERIMASPRWAGERFTMCIRSSQACAIRIPPCRRWANSCAAASGACRAVLCRR